jgi:hypothetical protein
MTRYVKIIDLLSDGHVINILLRCFCANIKPVGPAPMMSTSMPTGAASLSNPWMAHAAGLTRVASSSVIFWILKTLDPSLEDS